MKTLSLTLSGVLLATSALIAPGLAYAQSAPAEAPAQVAAAAEPQDDSTQVDEIVVLGRYIPEPNRESPEVAAFLTAEDLTRTGDSNAAEALTRVTGLSIVEGRFIYVRGLGERYSSAMLNGSPLPSPEPLQRVIPLDLFPSDILAGVTVQKTYSANYPGEFGGGLIDLQTISTPSDPFFTFKASLGANTETTAQEGLIYFGARTDFLGFDDGTRDIPGPIDLAFGSGKRINANNYTAAELRRMGQSLINSPLRLLQREQSPVNFGLGMTAGAAMDTEIGTVGAVFVAGYDNAWKSREGVRQTGRLDAGRLVIANDFGFQSTQNDIGLNFLGGLSLVNGDNEIKWTNLYVRNVTKEARSQEGFDDAAGSTRRTDLTAWYVRQLLSTQLTGEHFFGESWEFNWRAAYAQTSRDAPYETQFGYGKNAAGAYIHSIQSNSTAFSELNDDVVSGGADLSYILPLSDYREAKFTVGASAYDNNRDSAERRLRFNAINTLSADQLESRVDYLFSDFNIGPYLQLEEVTGSNGASAYEGQLTVNAVYAQVEAEVIPLVNLTVGVRYEDGEQTVSPMDLFGATTGLRRTTIDEQYVLPAATVTWNFAEDMQLRLAASKTIGRPQFRELAPQQYRDIETDRTFIGNQFLVDTEITNLDARFEWYFARQQFITAGVFYKDLENPVESSVVDQGSNISQTFLNAPRARIVGAEIEAKKYLEFPDNGMDFIANKRWLIQANYTYSDSEVTVEAGDKVLTQSGLGVAENASFYVVDGSRLQGQSDHVANVQLGWEDDVARSQATFIINYVSERTSARNIAGNPDLIQDPGTFLDFVYRKDFDVIGRELGFALELRNLLGTSYSEYEELGSTKIDVNSYDLGQSASISLTARF
ncbi:TonB-dependent receptor domain-containing protein [Brevundimonas sp. SL161]|uniref:TonB-dependent receptor domain-containing protein n=1 Tax=Brevundimonas sp. SL161 TaxID=2804613 RepID=UPI003CF1DDDD